LLYVMSLMRANRESVGGLPAPAVEERIARGTLLLASINDEPAGYLLYDVRADILRIPQACIQYDARRRKYAETLVATLLSLYPDVEEVRLRCAADLEANLFWRDMGFVCLGTSAGGRRRGRTINSWAMWLTPRLILPGEISVRPAAEIRQDCMYDDSGYLSELPEGFDGGGVLPKLAWANRKP
jgi:hypothetical protein